MKRSWHHNATAAGQRGSSMGFLRSTKNRASERGQSLLELALTLPLFLLLLLGTVEFAQFAWVSILASSAARAGASYGSQNSVTASDADGIRAAAANDSTNLSGLTTTPTLVCYCSSATSTTIACPAGTDTDLTNCPSPNIVLKYVQVNTTVTVTPAISYPGLWGNFTANGTSIMEVVGE